MKLAAEWIADPATGRVMAALTAEGATAYFVGGCVRNALMGLEVADIDIATPLPPEAVIARAEDAGLKAIPTGIKHGTVTLVADGQPFEVTTFRRDVETDGRRAVVAFSQDLAEDAARRDFTMNALYATSDGTVVDPLGGLPDLQARRVRFIGAAADRIAEDGLRIVRFFRFHALYGDAQGGIDPDGLAAVASGLDHLRPISRERIGAEMEKLLGAPDPAPAAAAMAQSGVLALILPGADPRGLAPLVHLEEGSEVRASWLCRLAVLGGEAIPKRLRLSRKDAKALAAIVNAAESLAPPAEIAVDLGAAQATDALFLRAVALEQPLPSGWRTDIARGAAARFPLTAGDLLDRYGETPALGAALARLRKDWIDSGFTLNRQALLARDPKAPG